MRYNRKPVSGAITPDQPNFRFAVMRMLQEGIFNKKDKQIQEELDAICESNFALWRYTGHAGIRNAGAMYWHSSQPQGLRTVVNGFTLPLPFNDEIRTRLELNRDKYARVNTVEKNLVQNLLKKIVNHYRDPRDMMNFIPDCLRSFISTEFAYDTFPSLEEVASQLNGVAGRDEAVEIITTRLMEDLLGV